MSLVVKEVKERATRVVSFWHKPYVLERLDTICAVSHVDKSVVFRMLVDLFLNDIELQERVLRGLKNNV